MIKPGGSWLAFVTVCLVSVWAVSGCAAVPTKGTLPPPGPNGQLDPSTAPDFLAVADRTAGIAGYARKGDVLGPSDNPFPVYADDLRTLVGHMVPGVGFVPLGVDPASLPTFSVSEAPAGTGSASSGKVALYVRNDGEAIAWVTVLLDGKPSDSTGYFGLNLGAGCYGMPPGSRLVLLDHPLAPGPGPAVVRQLYASVGESNPPSIWLVVGRDGILQQGEGVPAWWGPPQKC